MQIHVFISRSGYHSLSGARDEKEQRYDRDDKMGKGRCGDETSTTWSTWLVCLLVVRHYHGERRSTARLSYILVILVVCGGKD